MHNTFGPSERAISKGRYIAFVFRFFHFLLHKSVTFFVFECIVTKHSTRISRQFRNPFAIYRNPSQCVQRQGSSLVPVFISRTVMVAAGPAETPNNPVCCRLYFRTLRIYFDNFQFRTRMLCALRMKWFYCISV